MDIRWIENAREAFMRIYGPERGSAVCNAVIPGVMGDFRKMVMAAVDGAAMREDYRVDDKRAAITMEGYRRGSACVITAIRVNGEVVDLGAAELVL